MEPLSLYRGMLGVAICIVATGNASASDVATCRLETDSLRRLTCYDSIVVPVAPAIASQKVVASLVRGELRHQAVDTGRGIFNPRVELSPIFRNESKKPIVALLHRFRVIDAFGDTIITQDDKLDIAIKSGSQAKSPSYYYWEDNPFISDQPYDRLRGPVEAGTAKVEAIVKRVIYTDGTSETLP